MNPRARYQDDVRALIETRDIAAELHDEAQ